MFSRATLLIILFLQTSAASFAEHPAEQSTTAHIEHGMRLLDLASQGRSDAADLALDEFDAALAVQPANARAHAGRGLALIAQAVTAPMATKLALARKGCAELDAAVAADPENSAVRLLRATSAMQMPRLLERAAIAESDLAHLLREARDTNVTMAPETRRGIFYQAAAFALKERRTGAVELLQEASSIAASRPTDEQIQSLLALAGHPISPPSHADRHPQDQTPASRP